MKKLFALLMVLPLALFTLGCDSVEDDPDPGDDPTAIHGTWVSEGDNLAPGLVGFFGTTHITATFRSDNTYEVTELRGPDDPPIVLTGIYTTEASTAGNIRSITLEQEQGGVTAQGIYEVHSGDQQMRYEIIQTDPFVGAVPATPAGGFGSTSIGGEATGAVWIQNYVRTQ